MIQTNLNTIEILQKYSAKDMNNHYVHVNEQYISTQLKPSECDSFYMDDLLPIKNELLSAIQSNRENLEILEVWMNAYYQDDFNEIHNHSDERYTNKCEFTGILILDCGSDEHLIIYDEQNQPQYYNINPGQLYIVGNETLHGLDTVKDKVIAIMFMLKT